MRKLFLYFLFFVVFLSFFILWQYKFKEQSSVLCIESECFEIEIPSDEEGMKRGLMFRDYLDRNHGMLFIFDKEGIHSFWMKNTKIPLDIIWMDKNMKIVHIESDVQPCISEPCKVYSSKENSRYVLEINANLSNQLSINLGDNFYFSN